MSRTFFAQGQRSSHPVYADSASKQEAGKPKAGQRSSEIWMPFHRFHHLHTSLVMDAGMSKLRRQEKSITQAKLTFGPKRHLVMWFGQRTLENVNSGLDTFLMQ